MNFRLDYSRVEKRIAKEKKEQAKDPVREKKLYSLAARRVVVTGTIPGMSRRDVERLIDRYGGTMQLAVTSITDFVIQGNTRGAKTTKIRDAEKNRIPVVEYNWVKEFAGR